MNFKEFTGSIQNPEPLYIVKSDQGYLCQKVLALCEKQVQEAARAFDWSVFDLEIKDSEKQSQLIRDIVNTARTLPWMSSRRWIYVKKMDSIAEKISEYAKNPALRTVLVIEGARKPKNWPKVPIVQMEDRVDFGAWIVSTAKREGFLIPKNAAEVLVEIVGDDFQRLESELEKLFLFNLDKREISIESVTELAIEARERDIFELIGSIAQKDQEKAVRVLQKIFEAGASPQQILAMLYWNFRRLLVAKEMLDEGSRFQHILGSLKIWSYRGREKDIRNYDYEFLTEILLRIRQTDRVLKTTSYSPKQQLEKLIVDTCR
jgi:DNA polymerase III delta subunit